MGAFLINSLGKSSTLTELAMYSLGYEGSDFDSVDNEEFVSRAVK